jgi:sugar/nucleoside kinase (ribokinase family)
MVKLKEGSVIVVGDAVLDLTSNFNNWPRNEKSELVNNLQLTPGGTGLNTAIGLARLGVPVEFLGRFSEDIFGLYLRNHTLNEGIHLGFQSTSDLPTRIVLSRINRKGQPTYLAFNKPSADDDLIESIINFEKLNKAFCVFVTGLSLRFEPSRNTVIRILEVARDFGVTTIFDPNIRSSNGKITSQFRKVLNKALSLTNIYLPNKEEDDIIQDLKKTNVNTKQSPLCEAGSLFTKVVKYGTGGCILIDNNSYTNFPAFKVKTIDKTGAGDAFNAGFLFGLYSKLSIVECCRLANIVAALNTTKKGASIGMPRLSELDFYLKSIQA